MYIEIDGQIFFCKTQLMCKFSKSLNVDYVVDKDCN